MNFLGVDISKLPDEFKEAMTNASKAAKRYQKSVDQKKLWTEEADIAAQEHASAQLRYNEILKRWDTETNTLRSLEELISPRA